MKLSQDKVKVTMKFWHEIVAKDDPSTVSSRIKAWSCRSGAGAWRQSWVLATEPTHGPSMAKRWIRPRVHAGNPIRSSKSWGWRHCCSLGLRSGNEAKLERGRTIAQLRRAMSGPSWVKWNSWVWVPGETRAIKAYWCHQNLVSFAQHADLLYMGWDHTHKEFMWNFPALAGSSDSLPYTFL